MRRIVDLPQPDGPSSATTSLGRMASVDVLEHAQRLAVGQREVVRDAADLAERIARIWTSFMIIGRLTC